MEKEIKLTLSLEKAKKYYNSGINDLKEIALLAYNENVLNPITYNVIANEMFKKGYCYPNTRAIKDLDRSITASSAITYTEGYFNTHDIEFLKYIAVYIKVKNMADYFNRDYLKNDKGYEITNPDRLIDESHTNILFMRSEDAKKAYELLSEEEKTHLNYLII